MTGKDGKLLHMQYGCGFSAPETWLNFDASPTLRAERLPIVGRFITKNERRFPQNVLFGDITKGLPLEPGSCRAIYCSHVLEHLSREDCELAIARTLGYLASGGVFRLVMPDLEQLVRDYVASGAAAAAHEFMLESGIGTASRPRSLPRFVIEYLGNSRHLWLWDERALRAALEHAGFTSIRRCSFGDASDPAFRDVEEADRFRNALAMECRRP